MKRPVTLFNLAIAMLLCGLATSAPAERTILSETCNRTDISTVWFDAVNETVTLTATAEDTEHGTTVSRVLTFQDGRSVNLLNGNNFLYDATGISCDTYLAVAKSSVLYSLSSGHLYREDLHEDYKAILRGEDPCLTPTQSPACITFDNGTLYVEDFSQPQLDAFDRGDHAILTLRNHPFGLSTYALALADLELILLYYEGT